MASGFGWIRRWERTSMSDRMLLTFMRVILLLTCVIMATALVRAGLLSVSLGV
nr:MAG TPA: hypothetical protein [Caudoviricetes sp.]